MKLPIAIGTVLLLCTGPAAAPADAAAATAAAPVARPQDAARHQIQDPARPLPQPAQLAEYFDGAVPGRLAADHVPGLTVSVVGDGRTIFSKGYGRADLERGTAFDPARSGVRIASISKLFTWTAVMQLVQAGRLDLRRDVNDYLTGFRIPDTFAAPITLAHLMSHTAGFEDRGIGIGARTKADVPPLETYLGAHIPARVRPPGQMSAYSNYGAALAGHIVAQVSGQSYEQYVQQHILDPLGMRHSTAEEPVPARLAADQAASYDYVDGAYRRIPFTFDKLVPDGSISATANDLARFMIAHLQDGRLGDTRVLAESTARLMHQRSFAPDPRLDGYAHGFKERTLNGHRVIMHDGSWEGFQSALILVPDRGLGLFLSANSTGGIDAAGPLIDGFFDRFVPASSVPTESATAAGAGTAAGSGTAAADAGARPVAELAGFYVPTRRAQSTVAKLLNLGGASRLRVRENGDVLFQQKTWRAVGPNLYRQVGGTDRQVASIDRLAFVTDRGSADYLATDGPVYERVPWRETPLVNLVALGFFAVVAVSAVLGLPAAAAVRRWRRRPSAAPLRWRIGRGLATGAAAVGLIFLGLLVATLVGDTSEFLYAAPLSFRALLVLPLVTVALAAAAAVTTVVAWRPGPAGVLARGHQVILLVALTALIGFLLQWNLLGWRFG
jgi:CubicO group peptidase (beta-lactamase class C family)